MTPDPNDQQVSLDDDETAFKAASDALAPVADDGTSTSAPVVPAETPWEPPGWASRWKPEARDVLGRFVSHPDFKPHAEPLLKQMEEINGYTTRRDQEFSDFRKRLDPIYDVLKPYEQRYARDGISLHQGVQQVFAAAEYLSSNPDEAFPWLARAHRPRDPAALLRSLGEAWGVDPSQAFAEGPYIDPSIATLVTPLQRELAELKQWRDTQQVTQTQQQQAALVQEIEAFELQQDENGQPKHPYFREVFDDMLTLVQMGRAKDLASAYDMATRYSPTVQERTSQASAEKARQKALEEAAARTANTEKAANASRQVGGKSKGQGTEPSDREAWEKAKATHS